MNRKTVKVDLSLFFEDERKMSYIFVDPSWKTVQCLQKRLELLFGISSVWLLSDGCFLPSEEPIEIVRSCDVIKAFVPKESLEIRKSKKSKKGKETTEKPKNKDLSSEKNKQKDVYDELVASTRVTITESPILRENSLVAKSSKEPNQSIFKNSKNSAKKQKFASEEARLSKIASSTLLNESNLLEQYSKPRELSKSANINNPFKKRKSSKAHIYFNESGDTSTSTPKSKEEINSLPKSAKKQETIVLFRCALNDVTNSDDASPLKPRIFHLIPKNASKKQKIVIQEDILIPTQSMQNGKNESSLTNESTIMNNVFNETNETDVYNKTLPSNNSTIGEIDKNEQTGINNLNNYQNEKTNINEAKNESNAMKDVNENSNENKAELTSVDEPVCEMQNESQKELNISVDAAACEISNKSQMDLTSVENDETIQGEELSSSEIKDKTDINQTLNNENTVMSVDCVDLSIDLEEDADLKDDIQDDEDFNADNETKHSSASDVEEVSEIIDLNESEYNCNSTVNPQMEQTISPTNIRVNKILPFSTEIRDLPDIEDIIVFKVSYTNSSKNRVNTNFLAGKVENVNKRSKYIKVLILDGISELCQIPSHFVCGLKDSNESVKHLKLKFSDLVEPKLFSTS